MIEIEIIANGKLLVLPDNIKISYQDNSPMFGDGTILGAKTYPMTVPTKENAEALGLQMVLNNYKPLYTTIQNVFIKLNKKVWIRGTLKIRSVNSKTTSINIYTGISNLVDAKNKKIAEFIDDEIQIPQGPVYKRIIAIPEARMINGSEAGTMHMYFDIEGPFGSWRYFASINGPGTYEAALEDIADQINADKDIHKIECQVYPWEEGMMTQGANQRDALLLWTDITNGDPYEGKYIFEDHEPGYLLDWRTYMSSNVRNGDDLGTYVLGVMTGLIDEQRISFPTIYSPYFYGKGDQSVNTDYFGIINSAVYLGPIGPIVPYNSHNFRNTRFANFHYSKWTFVPYPRLKYIIDSIFGKLGIKVSGKFYNSEDFNKLVMDNNTSLDETVEIYRRVFNGEDEASTRLKFNVGKQVIRLKDHVWDMTLGQFLNELKNKFNLGFFYSKTENSIEIIVGEDLLRSADIEDLTDISPLFEVEPTEPQGYVLQAEPDGSDEAFSITKLDGYTTLPSVAIAAYLPPAGPKQKILAENDNLWRYSYPTTNENDEVVYSWAILGSNLEDSGTGINAISSKINTLFMGEIKNDDNALSNPMGVPLKLQKGSSDEFGLGKNPSSPRLLFYHGPNGVTCWSSNNGINGNVIETSFSLLNYDKSGGLNRGLYEVFWKNWLKMLDTAKKVSFPKRFSVTDLLNFRADNKKRVQSNNYIYSSLKLTITNKKIEEGTIELIR